MSPSQKQIKSDFRRFVREVINNKLSEISLKAKDQRQYAQIAQQVINKKYNQKIKDYSDFDQSFVAAGVYSGEDFSPLKAGSKARKQILKTHNKMISDAMK